MPTLGIARINLGNHVLKTTVRGGIASTVTFKDGELTENEKEYCRLVAHTNFFQLVRTAIYMQEGLSFRNATIKYLKAEKEAKVKFQSNN